MKGFSILLTVALCALPAAAQVFTVTPENVDAKYLQITPTDIKLPTAPLTQHDRQQLLRYLQSEQGFTMRPLPIATLTLRANGQMKPNGSDYANLIDKKGLAAKAGQRVVISDVTIEKDRIILDFDGGPVHKHRWLRHISIGMDPYNSAPLATDKPNEAMGSRITLVFSHGVPDLTGFQVEALIKPIVDFNVKTPLQAYTDTLPPFLRKAILAHQVLVGMNRQMVLSALGDPRSKMREVENNEPVEIWLYGMPPQPTQFVRFNGGRVIRLEIARVGEPIEVHAKNEMGDYWATQLPDNARVVKLGDQSPQDVSKETAPTNAPTLRNPGEQLPADKDPNTPQMGPVQFPKDEGAGSQQPTTAQQQPASPQQQSAPQQPATQQQGTTQPAPQTTQQPNQNQFTPTVAASK